MTTIVSQQIASILFEMHFDVQILSISYQIAYFFIVSKTTWYDMTDFIIAACWLGSAASAVGHL